MPITNFPKTHWPTLNAIAILGGIVGEQALSPYVQEILQLFYQGPLLGQIKKDFVPTGSLGAEYTIDRNWSVRAEYQRYQDLSDDVWDDTF